MTVSREAIEAAVLAYAEAVNPGQPATWRLDGPLRKRMEAALTAALPHLLPLTTTIRAEATLAEREATDRVLEDAANNPLVEGGNELDISTIDWLTKRLANIRA